MDGVLLGIGVAVPFGPVNLLILSYALSSFKKAFFLGLGALVADAFYLLLLSFGI
ncbi:LysE family transporter, partial [Campylobacter upsaliensis]